VGGADTASTGGPVIPVPFVNDNRVSWIRVKRSTAVKGNGRLGSAAGRAARDRNGGSVWCCIADGGGGPSYIDQPVGVGDCQGNDIGAACTVLMDWGSTAAMWS